MKKSLLGASLVITVFLARSLTAYALADEIRATLHPQPGVRAGDTVTVSFGMPFPKYFISDSSLIRVKDEQGREIPAYVRVILQWRDIASGETLPAIRSALIQFDYTFRETGTPAVVTVEAGTPGRSSSSSGRPVRENWVRADDSQYPASYGVYEPTVYVTLPPEWLGRCAIKSRTVPFGTYGEFSWYDESLTNNDSAINSGRNFFMTMSNTDPGVSTGQRVNYRAFSPWLYDRAMTLYGVYLRSGSAEALREAHRAAYFYGQRINSSGYFTLKNGDPKYSYGESMLTDLIIMGDEGHLGAIRRVASAGRRFNYRYNPSGGFWTERHLAFSWLGEITAFEATGNAGYAARAREIADYVFEQQNNPPRHPDHGRAPNNGALMHSLRDHEGNWSNSQPWWIFSPWMTALLVDSMQRYYQHSGDDRVLESAQRFADAVISDALRNRNFGGELGRLRVPSYFGYGGREFGEVNRDYEHSLDVAKITAFAYHCSVLSGSPERKYLDETLELLKSARRVIDHSIIPENASAGRPVYTITPSRKAGWWFRITQDLDYLLNYDGTGMTDEILAPGKTALRQRTAVQGGVGGHVNPGAGETARIFFRPDGPGEVNVRIFNQRGQMVWERTEHTNGDTGYIEWDCLNLQGTDAASGVYVAVIEAPGINMTRKIAVVR